MQPLLLFYERFREDGFEVVTISIDENASEALSVFGEQQPPWISLVRSDESFEAMLNNLGVQMVPYMILVDKTGKVYKIHVPLRDLEPSLLKLLGKAEDSQSEPAASEESGE